MSKERAEVEASLEEQARVSNAALSDTLQQLFYEVQPKTQLNYLLEDAKYKVEEVKYNVLTTLDEAKDGDAQARSKVLKAAAIGTGVVALMILKRRLKRRKHR